MKLAICNETFVDWPHARAFEFARECGYTGIEIAPFTLAKDVRAVTPQQIQEMRSLAERFELEIIGLHWLLAKTEGYHLTSPDAVIRQATTEYLQDLGRCCRELGGSVLVFGSPLQRNLLPGVSHEQATEFAVEVFSAAMPVLEDLDVILAVEPLGPAEGNFLLTAAEAAALIERVGSTHCRLHLDCKAMSSEVQSIPEIIRQYAPLLTHFHANDPNRRGPGMGDLEFLPILEALAQIDYRGWVSVEVFDYSPGPERLAKESIDYLRERVEQLMG
ncbi:MAG: sugar phosphate isomerase/epimerase family protein [Planctomycetia bacterium]|nr:sugar phosphate isomerase/epimerase family protein [Planctomycetia bacterium]